MPDQPEPTPAITPDPNLDGKVAALSQMLAPEWSGTLSAFSAANSGTASTAQVMAALPGEAQADAGIAGPLLAGDLGGALSAIAGKFLPPQMQAMWAGFQQLGALAPVLGIQLPKLPPPFAKPKPPAPSSADLSTDSGSGCGMAPLAARISDVIACPKGGGPIITGQMNVLVGFMPAARIGDKAVCVGPPDVITDGERTVLIGNSPASRLADKTAHAGSIASGYATVQIGKSHAPCAMAAAARRAAFVINGPAAE